MWGSRDSGAARVRALSDSVRDLKITLDHGISTYKAAQKVIVDGQSLAALRNLQSSIDGLTQQLQMTNMQLSNLSQRPIIGMLGGGAEQELQRLVQYLDAINKAVKEAFSLVNK